jgi:hypothetical protein
MKPARIDLEFRSHTPLWLRGLGWALLAVGVGLMVWLGGLQEAADQQREDARTRLAALQASQEPEPATQADAEHEQDTEKQVQRANAVIDRLALPWDVLFRSVEVSGGKGLGLLTMAPNPEDRSVRLSGEAKTLDEVLAYIDRLGAQPVLSHVHLVSFETVQREGSEVVGFVVGAQWR